MRFVYINLSIFFANISRETTLFFLFSMVRDEELIDPVSVSRTLADEGIQQPLKGCVSATALSVWIALRAHFL
jgi:hypothetical protein